MDEERRAKRSRFDDRPRSERRRSASPETKVEDVAAVAAAAAAPPVSDAVLAAKKKAAEAAARISAMLKNKKASSPAVTPKPPSASPAPRPPPDEVNEQGLYVRDIEVNDLRNRYLVVKESTLEEIKTKTGAEIEVRGKYYPDKSMATERDPPMFLHISSSVKTKMEAAVGMANRLINSELGPLVDERRFRKKDDFERDEFGRRKWPEEKVMIDMAPLRGFHLRASVVGTGGANVKFVQSETRTRIQIKGQGSGFVEVDSGKESDEPMHLHIAGPDAAEVHRAKGMLEDLIASIRVKYEEFKINGPSDDRDRSDRFDSPAHGQGSPAPGSSVHDYSSQASYIPPPPGGGIGSASIPPFSYSSAPPPLPPGSSSFPPPPTNHGPASSPPGGYASSSYAPPPPPAGENVNSSYGAYPAPPAPPGSSSSPYRSNTHPPPPPAGDEYDPYAPSSGGYPRPPGT